MYVYYRFAESNASNNKVNHTVSFGLVFSFLFPEFAFFLSQFQFNILF